MPRLLSVLCLVLCWPGLPAAAATDDDLLFERFAPETLEPAEIRLLQAALTAEGVYSGPLDGVWRRGAALGTEDYAWREFADSPLNLHVAALAATFLMAIDEAGWTHVDLDGSGLWMALPELALTAPEPEDGGTRRWSLEGTLTLLSQSFDDGEARAWHAAAKGANTDPAAPPPVREPARLVTSGRLGDGRDLFTRSDLIEGHWATVFLASGPDESAKFALMRASTGARDDWTIPPGGRLDRLVHAARALVADLESRDGPAPQNAALPAGDGLAASGTGFYVSDRELVTAQHVIGGCEKVALDDGTELTVLAADPELDIAVLRAPRANAAWLTLAPHGAARLGQQVHAMGFPYYGITGTSLHLTGGNVSALVGVNDDARFFSFTAPVQPGNSGGPLIAHDGEVLGLVVSRLSERWIEETTGTLPQNINYALGPQALAAFLQRAGVTPRADGLDGFDLEKGMPPVVAAAVRPVICG